VNDNDIIICYNSRLLFGDGDIEHISLIQEIDTENDELTIVGPAIGVPKTRRTKLSKLIHVLKSGETSRLGGFLDCFEDKLRATQNSVFSQLFGACFLILKGKMEKHPNSDFSRIKINIED
jgi:hypothetical protein